MVAPHRGGGRRSAAAELPDTVQACWRRGSTRSSRSSAGSCSTPRWWAAPSGRASLAARGRARRGATSTQALSALQEKDILVPGEGSALAGERELAFKHVLIRDVAYGMLPKAVRAAQALRGRAASSRSARATAPTRSWRCSPSTTAAPRRSAARRGDGRRRARAHRSAKALHFLEAAGDAAASLYSNREAFAHYEARARPRPARTTRRRSRAIGEKQGDVALRLGRVDAAIEVWQECLEYQRRQEDLERVADLHRKIGAGATGTRASASAAIEHYQKGINLLKDGPPLHRARAPLRGGGLAVHADRRQHARHLRLREGAAPGRAARRDARRQPRARDLRPRVRPHRRHREGAREPRARGRAGARLRRRRDDPRAARAGPAPRGVGGRLRAARRRAYAEALALAEEIGDVPAQVELHAVARAAGRATARTGTPVRELHRGQRRAQPSARGWSASSASRTCCAGCCTGARASGTRPSGSSAARTSWPSRWAGPRRRSRRCSGWPASLRDRGDLGGAGAALGQALDVCERAGPHRAVDPGDRRARASRAGDGGQGRSRPREAAEEAAELAERLHYPVGRAAALQAEGFATGEVEQAAAAAPRLARDRPPPRRRPLPPPGRQAASSSRATPHAATSLEEAAAEFEGLAVPQLSQRAREARWPVDR